MKNIQKKSANRKTATILFSAFVASICITLAYTFLNIKTFHTKNSNYRIDTMIYKNLNMIRTKNDIKRIDAELSGEKLKFGFRNTKKFIVPMEYKNKVCSFFSGEINESPVINENTMRKSSQLGTLYFYYSKDEHIKIDFFTVGKGALGFYFDDVFLVAVTDDIDGGRAILELLTEAYNSAKTD